MRRFLGLFSIILILFPAVSAAKSIALIVGNDSYVNIAPLQKARSDAAGYQSLFQSMGFDVTMHTDLARQEMSFELATFFDRIGPGDTVVFVFTGHGWSDGSDNFLVPTDMRASGSETLIARESFSLRNGANGIIDEITKRGAGLTLAIVDACRDNPFAPSEGTRSIGLARGLVPIEAPTGTFVAFSAGAGQTALDRLSNNDPAPYSVFTRHFLTELAKPQDLQSAFKRTQQLVNEDAGRVGHPQRPAYYDEVIGAACLSTNCGATELAVVAPTPEAPVQDLNAQAAQAWRAFENSNSVEALRLFEQQYSGTAYAALAQERILLLEKPAVQPETTVQPPQPAAPTRRPSWCGNAQTSSERAICGNDRLATLDLQLEAAYNARRQSLGTNARARLLVEQRNWLSQRNSCGGNTPCLSEAYIRRLSVLRN